MFIVKKSKTKDTKSISWMLQIVHTHKNIFIAKGRFCTGCLKKLSTLVICSFVGFYSCKLQKLGHFWKIQKICYTIWFAFQALFPCYWQSGTNVAGCSHQPPATSAATVVAGRRMETLPTYHYSSQILTSMFITILNRLDKAPLIRSVISLAGTFIISRR